MDVVALVMSAVVALKADHIPERILPPVIPAEPRIKSGGATGEQRFEPGSREVRLVRRGPG